MDLAKKIEYLADQGLHDILFRNAGVGLLFYEGDYDDEGVPVVNWRNHLVVHDYYPTITKAVNTEYKRVRRETSGT